MGWLDWIMPKEVEDQDDHVLEKALAANRMATKEAVRIEQESREKSQTLIELSENALKVLDLQSRKKK